MNNNAIPLDSALPEKQKTEQKKLNSWEVTAISIGFMGPVMAMSLNGIGVAGVVGKAVPFTFLIASIGTLFVGYAFVRMLGEFTHAGSVYALAGITLGPKAGFFGGFALLGTYIFMTACILGACSVFFEAIFLQPGTPGTGTKWVLTPVVVGLLGLTLNLRDSKFVARTTLAIGLLGILVMLILAAVILFNASTSSNLTFRGIDWTVLTPGEASWSAVLTASVFAFISWAGFESGASLAEEAREPKRTIPRSLFAAIALGGVLYTVLMFAQTIGYGTTDEGIEKFAGASSTLTELASTYIGEWYSVLISIIAFIVACGAFLSSSMATSRLLFSLARDGFGPPVLAKQHPKSSVPVASVILTCLLSIVMTAGLGISGASNVDAYYWYATIGTLCMVVAYAMASVGALKFIISGSSQIPIYESVFPIIAILYLGFVFVVQVVGQEAPYSYFPWLAGFWCCTGLAIVLCRPQLAAKIGSKLERE